MKRRVVLMVVFGLAGAGATAAEMSFDEAVQILRDEKQLANHRMFTEALRAVEGFAKEDPGTSLKRLRQALHSLPKYSRGVYRRRALDIIGRGLLPAGEQAIKALTELARDEKIATDAIHILLMTFREKSALALTELLTDKKLSVRFQAIKALGHRYIAARTEVPVSPLLKLLKERNRELQREICRALIGYGEKASAALGSLLRIARQADDVSVRIFAVRAIGAIGSSAQPATETLLELLRSESLSLRCAVIEALGNIGPGSASAVPALLNRLLDAKEDWYAKELSATALSKLGEEGMRALRTALESDDEMVCYESARSLALCGEKAIPLALDALRDENVRARRFGAFVLAKLGTEAKSAYKDLVSALKDKESEVRRNAIEALGRVGEQKVVKLIVPFLKDPAPDVARASAGIIETLVKDETELDRLLAGYRRRVMWKQRRNPDRHFDLPDSREFEIGGPLAGLKLPLFRTQHGEKPGYPGCIPELMEKARVVEDMGNRYKEWGPQGQSPELELYEGAVEHYRAYWFKYCPVRSFFDKQSLLKNWVAPDIPTAGKKKVKRYAEPVYWVPRHNPPKKTGRFMKPVPVIVCKVRSPIFKLDLGELDTGLYAVRVIGAVPYKKPRRFLKPLFLRMNVNDGLKGETNTYRVRCGYVDQFYSIAEIYFHAPERRSFQAELYVDEGTDVALLVHNITLDDVLAGTVREAIKARPVIFAPPKNLSFISKYLTEERLARDAELWRGLPPLNTQSAGGFWATATHYQSPEDVVRFGMNGMSVSEIEQKYGKWKPGTGRVFLVNEKLGLIYTIDELRARKPLPDPYPFKDDGAGLYRPDPKNPNRGEALIMVASAVGRKRSYYGSPDRRRDADAWLKKGDIDSARDEAIRLIRIAYRCPAIDSANNLCAVTSIPAAYRRDIRCRRRMTQASWLSWYTNYLKPPLAYDKLFTYIDGNEELAQSVGRFVPWVKTSEDLIKLLDVYLVQTIAKRVLRYHYYVDPMVAGELALILDNQSVTGSWIEWLFSRTFVYPLKPAGIQDLMISGCDRSGPEYIGSTFYAQGEGASRVASSLDKFRKRNILPEKYDLTRTDLYPKPLAHCYWRLSNVVAGREFLRIGDVCGPDKRPGHTLRNIAQTARLGWEWSHDSRFAWVLRYAGKRGEFTEEEWAEIERSARSFSRAPWLENRSRQVYNWAGVLESGLQHDDPRFRRAVYLRTGLGIGHHHNDSLDLQIVAHGLPMTIDGGQRPGYSSPGDRTTRTHNTVEVNESNHYLQSWVAVITDAEGARYLKAKAEPPESCKVFERQVALIDVDEGKGSQKLPPEKAFPDALLPKGIATANSYVFDVFRVSGGSVHTYCFHGPITDELKVNSLNRTHISPPEKSEEPTPEQTYLRMFGRTPESWFAGDAPDVLEATWRYSRKKGYGSEQFMAGPNFDPNSPRKYTRLMLFDTRGMRVLEAQTLTHRGPFAGRHYRLTHIFAQRRGEELESTFHAIIEPYAGEPFIAHAQSIRIPNNETDALRAVAVKVRTRNGHEDICFADGRPEKVRTVGELKVSAEFAFYSKDTRGLRLASLTGGMLLETPELILKPSSAQFNGKVISVNYLKRQMVIDKKWNPASVGRVFEVDAGQRTTSYTLRSVQPNGAGSVLTLQNGADYYRSRILKVGPGGVVVCQVKPVLDEIPGLNKNFTATNDQITRFWKADLISANFAETKWQLKGAPVSEDDFKPEAVLRLWEYGPGDTARLSTFVSIRRLETNLYELAGDVNLLISIKARRLEISSDRKDWKALPVQRKGEWLTAKLALGQSGHLFLRLTGR